MSMNSKYIFLFLPLLLSMKVSFKFKDWTHESYKKIPQNEVEYSKNSLLIKSKESASPLIHIFKKPIIVKQIKVKGRVKVIVPPKKFSSEDAIFQIGLITKGTNKLNFWQKMIAPSWLKELDEKLKFGIGDVCFLGVDHFGDRAKRQDSAGGIKISYATITKTNKLGEFTLDTNNFCTSGEVAAVWLRVDSDNTKSHYHVEISEIDLK